MTRAEAERELASAERDLAAALARYKELDEELGAAEQWVSAAMHREAMARMECDKLPFQMTTSSTVRGEP